jgi:CubicO group peptidase (beta-lactamase class C family)
MQRKDACRAGKSVAMLISLAIFCASPPVCGGSTGPERTSSQAIQKILGDMTRDGKAPGMLAAITSAEGVVAIGSAGVRKAGSLRAIRANDLVHLGSCTKAMTAVMLATLVAEGKLGWDMNMMDAIPELQTGIHPDYHRTTPWQLLTHRARLPHEPADWWAYPQKDIAARRLALLKDNLIHGAAFPPGEFNYSNFGYMIAACMAEQVTGLSWETLMRKRLFIPLGMTSAGFGPADTTGQIDQPWGHHRSGGQWEPRVDDDAESLGPAGEVHCTLADWGKFLALFLAPHNPVVHPRYLQKLTEPAGFYAGGWGVANQPWAKGAVLTHNGSNGIWYATVLVAPGLHRAFMVATNSCDFASTPTICSQALAGLIKSELRTE